MSTAGATELESELVPSLERIAELIPITSTRHLANSLLGHGHSVDFVVGAVSKWLIKVVDWTDAGVPSGKLGTRGQLLVTDAMRVLVDDVERGRRPPTRPTRTGTPRPTVPRPAPVARASDGISAGAGTADEPLVLPADKHDP